MTLFFFQIRSTVLSVWIGKVQMHAVKFSD